MGKSIYALSVKVLLLDDPSLLPVPFQNCLTPCLLRTQSGPLAQDTALEPWQQTAGNQTLPRPALGRRPRPALQLWPSARDPQPGLSGGCGRRVGQAPGPETVPAESTISSALQPHKLPNIVLHDHQYYIVLIITIMIKIYNI